MQTAFLLIALSAAFANPTAVRAQDINVTPHYGEMTPQYALVQVLSTQQIDKDWFTAGFAKSLPIEDLQAQLDTLKSSLGNFFSARPANGYYDLQFSHGTAKAQLTLLGPQIDTLRIYDQRSRMTDDGEFRLSQIFRAIEIPEVLFSRRFLIEYPIQSVRSLVASYKKQYGAYRTIAVTGDQSYIIVFEHGSTGARVHLDENQKIDGMSFAPVAQVKPGAP